MSEDPKCNHLELASFPDDSGFICKSCYSPLKNDEVDVNRMEDLSKKVTLLGRVFINKAATKP